MEMTEKEKSNLFIIRLNKLFKKKEINKYIRIGALSVVFRFRSKKNFMGRFGGGWNWKLGFQAGGRAIIFSLLICSLTFKFEKKSHDKS